MQFEKAHLSQSNRMGACFFGQHGIPSAICTASSSDAAGVIVAERAEGTAATNGAAGPITTPTAIPSAKNQRMTARSFITAKIPHARRLEKPLDPEFGASRRRLHHALVRIRPAIISLTSMTRSLSNDLFGTALGVWPKTPKIVFSDPKLATVSANDCPRIF
jgi:hypothetical protein